MTNHSRRSLSSRIPNNLHSGRLFQHNLRYSGRSIEVVANDRCDIKECVLSTLSSHSTHLSLHGRLRGKLQPIVRRERRIAMTRRTSRDFATLPECDPDRYSHTRNHRHFCFVLSGQFQCVIEKVPHPCDVPLSPGYSIEVDLLRSRDESAR